MMKRHCNRIRRRDGFTLIEITAAICLYSVAMAMFYVLLHGLLRAQHRVWTERAALVVMNNCLERREAGVARDLATLKAFVEEEFDQSMLAEIEGVHAVVENGDAGYVVCIRNGTGVNLARIEMKP